MNQRLLNTAVIVAALGYFVDVYDLILFSIVRIPSLKSLGLDDAQVLSVGQELISIQMFGMLIGGILFGILGDKKGRITILFASILLYSLANFANGFITSVEQYYWLRLIAGIGLAGELGAGITLVSEIIPKEKRGYATMLIATVGVSGAILAYFVAEQFDWRNAYLIGGGLGLVLLITRFSVYESGMFNQLKNQNVTSGNFFFLFTSINRFKKFILCILIGIPVWYVVGIVITFSKEIALDMGVLDAIKPGKAVMYTYIGLIVGDFLSGSLCQWFKNRKIVLISSIGYTALTIFVFFFYGIKTENEFYFFAVLLGFAVGYWALIVSIAAEQFGTNIRATVTTSVPNLVRGSVPLLVFLFNQFKLEFSIADAALVLGIVVMSIAFISALFMEETFGKDLDYLEN